MVFVFLRARALLIVAWMGLTGAALALAGCGGEEGGVADGGTASAEKPKSPPGKRSSPPPSGTTNGAPTISGTPPTSVLQGVQYTFTPTASDPDGNALTFSVVNRPTWATFNSTTGRLSGTPSAVHVGTTSNVTITVSDGMTSASLPSFSIQVVATATGSVTLTWNPPTQNTDGTPLTNLSGYKLYWGTVQNEYSNSVTVNNPGIASYVIEQLTPARWYFAVTAVNAAGAESSHSNEASKQIL